MIQWGEGKYTYTIKRKIDVHYAHSHLKQYFVFNYIVIKVMIFIMENNDYLYLRHYK